MSKLFSRAGDDGSTGFLGEGRIPKEDIRFETLGTLDELSAQCGVVRAQMSHPGEQELIKHIQKDLYKIMAEVASDKENAANFRTIGADQVAWLEEQAERMAASIIMPSGFILPGETILSAEVSVARAVTRRAERRLAAMVHQDMIENSFLLQYLNRLSSLFFVLEVRTSKTDGSDITFARKEI